LTLRGTLFLVVGPSGAGKDALIAAARERLGTTYLVPSRVITRSQGSAGEDHIGVDDATFERDERSGAFALSWRAHGYSYGIPVTIEKALAAGTNVVVNVSRTVVDEARTKMAPVRVIDVVASPAVLAERLRKRGRENKAEVAERLQPRKPVVADSVVVNDGALETAVASFVAALQG
jgi:ribose 1,5-bisphosphokinase